MPFVGIVSARKNKGLVGSRVHDLVVENFRLAPRPNDCTRYPIDWVFS